MTIVLDTPAQISHWILASRVSQCHLHMKGIKVPGLAKWLKANIPDVTTERTVKDMYPRLLDYMDEMGMSWTQGEQCNYQILVTAPNLHPLYIDYGVVDDLSNEGFKEAYGEAYSQGRVIIIRTMESIRGRNPDKNMYYQG